MRMSDKLQDAKMLVDSESLAFEVRVCPRSGALQCATLILPCNRPCFGLRPLDLEMLHVALTPSSAHHPCPCAVSKLHAPAYAKSGCTQLVRVCSQSAQAERQALSPLDIPTHRTLFLPCRLSPAHPVSPCRVTMRLAARSLRTTRMSTAPISRRAIGPMKQAGPLTQQGPADPGPSRPAAGRCRSG